MLKTKKTKIIATLGPSSCSRAIIEQLFLRGVDVFRLNFSHGTHDEHRRTYGHIRDIEKVYGVPIAVLMDLQGPKLRVGTFKNGPVFLEDGQHFSFTLDPVEGDSTRVTLPHREVFQALVPETLILMDDGKLQLEVLSCGPAFAETRVKVGGKISSHKGVNLPNVALPLRAVTEKDEKDLCFGLELGVDFIGLSFVQCPEDVMEAQGLIQGIKTYEDMIREAPHILLSLDKGYLGSSVILTAGEPLGLAGGTNILRILKLEEDPQLPSNPPTPPSLNPSLYEG